MKSFRNIQQDKAPPSAKDLVDLPLADALKIYVHPGEKPKAKRGPRAQYTDGSRASKSMKYERLSATPNMPSCSITTPEPTFHSSESRNI